MSEKLSCKKPMRRKFMVNGAFDERETVCDATIDRYARGKSVLQCSNCGSVDGHHWNMGCPKSPQIPVTLAGVYCANGHPQMTE